MMPDASSAKPSVQYSIIGSLYDARSHLTDRGVWSFLCFMLFFLNCASNLFTAPANTFDVDNDLAHSRTASGAELLGFIAIAVVLKGLNSDRVLKRWDYLAIVG